MNKLLRLGSYFANTYEPTVQLLDVGRTAHLEKCASEAYAYAQTIKPAPGKRYILVIAMGAGEYWSSNANGDFFPEADLKRSYMNFETVIVDNKITDGALIYKHHKNKVAKGDPWFGIVKRAFYNDRMHRVELILEVHADKAADIVARIDAGDDISVSMGVRIPYDICCLAECRNKAKTRAEYCFHLLYQMNQILPDGRKVFAINGDYDYVKHKKPLNFFDISFVFRPADKTGWMLKKIASHTEETVGSAELYEQAEDAAEKIARLKKFSEIDKILQGQPYAEIGDDGQLRAISANKATLDRVANNMQPIDAGMVGQLQDFPLNKVLATLKANNMILSTPEFLSMVLSRTLGQTISPEAFLPLAQAQGEAFEELAADPDLLQELSQYEMFNDVEPDAKVAAILAPIRENRDLSSRGFIKKAMTDIPRSVLDWHDPANPLTQDHRGMLHTETITDPQTGKKYAVNMAAIEDARILNTLVTSGKLIGTTLLLASIYQALKSHAGDLGKAIAPVAGLAGIALGVNQFKNIVERNDNHAYTTTDQGTRVPYGVSKMEKRALFRPELNRVLHEAFTSPGSHVLATGLPLAGTKGLSDYYEERLQNGRAGMPQTQLEQKLDSAGRVAYSHPYLTAAVGVGGANLGLRGLDALRKSIFRR